MATALREVRTRSQPPRPSRRPPRDGFVDLLRAVSIVTIVGLHWLMPVISYHDGALSTANALAVGGGWAITWAAQVMPLIFFAGGAAAAMSLDARRRRHRPGADAGWIAHRLRRLSAPVIPLAVAWVPLPHLLLAIGVPAQPVEVAAALVGRLLWFLAAYLLLIIITPVLLRLHGRTGGGGIAILGLSAVAVDVLRFGWLGGVAWPGYANVLLVWGAIYVAGIHYGRGHRWGPYQALAFAVGGLVATGLAVTVGPYPAGMIGMPEAAESNMNPPTAVLLGVAAIQLGVVMAARRWLVCWASRAPVTALLGWISQRTMTIYLWHTPALVAVAGVAAIGFGYATPEPFSSAWRDTLPAWLALLTGTLAVLVRFAHCFEKSQVAVPARLGRLRAAGAVLLIGVGLLALTVVGFNPAAGGWPFAGAAALALGVGLASGRINLSAGWARAKQTERLAV